MTTSQTKSHRNVLLWLLFSSAISIAWGYWVYYSKPVGLWDFRAIYFGARAVIDHHDPYKENEFLQVYRQEGGELPPDPVRQRAYLRAVPICVNLPSTLFVVAPFALLSWGPAHLLWMILMPAGLILAGLLVWDLVRGREPTFLAFLICVLLANCQVLLQSGNGSGMAASLCVVAVWCFLKRRFEIAGVLCLALGLAIKPQEIAFIWLYFLLAGGMYRKRALQAAGIALVVVLLSVAWMSSAAPHWMQEWQSNVSATTAHGDLNDPGPGGLGNDRLGQVVHLQSVISYFSDDPRIFNSVSYLVCGALILVWGVATLRSRVSPLGTWLAIASISALSMLPVYHRQYDTKILILTIPAVAALWAQGSRMRKPALVVTTACMVLTADIPLATMLGINSSLHLPQDQLTGKLVSILLTRTTAPVLLVVGVFYLWLYVQHVWAEAAARNRADANLAVAAVTA